MLRRWLTLTVAALLAASAVVAIAPATTASALAPPPFNAWGTVRCTRSGTHTIKPGITAAAKANVVETVKANLSCSSGSTGQSAVTVKSGRLTATSVPASISCSSPLSPPLVADIKWTATGGKVNPTKVVWMGSNNTTSPRMGRSYPASTSVSGSYAQGVAEMVTVSTILGQPGCSTAGGLKKFAFSGLAGGSTFAIPSSPQQITQLFRDDFNGTALDRSKWRPNWFGALVGSALAPRYIPDNQAFFILGGMWIGTAQGLMGGGPALPGAQRLIAASGAVTDLPGCFALDVEAGDLIEIETPGGGGFGLA